MCSIVCLLLVFLLGEAATTIASSNNKDSVIFNPKLKYDVFVSFRGPDIRQGFLSHLVEAIAGKKIFVFVDTKIQRGDEISSSLVEAIETSFISLVIFSENYASSSWCLDELVKIVECKHKYGQIILPVFYKVTPTDVRHQKGSYAAEFAKHENKYNLSRVQQWRSALNESGNIIGYDASNFPTGALLVEEIISDVMKRLDDHLKQVHSKGSTGVDKEISLVESLLQKGSKDVRAIGICGMGGIGKTTIAEQVYSRICHEYEGCYFMANVREEWGRHGAMYLKKDLFSNLLREQDLKIDTPHGLPGFIERRLRRMKVLLVLDDVNDLHQLEFLIETLDWFGKGSRIIITTRDKQVLVKMVDDNDIYEIKALDFDDPDDIEVAGGPSIPIQTLLSSIAYFLLLAICFLVLSLLGSSNNKDSLISNNKDSLIFNRQLKYDVFVSFRGSDIHEGFVSHLIDGITRKNCVAFIDTKIGKGNDVSSTLVEAIETSFISLVIFSENYASSPWCLDELVKIVECNRIYGQIILPVFYRVTPTDVRHQKGSFAAEFAKHENKYSLSRVQQWRSALEESSNYVGYDASNFPSDALLVEEIISGVMKRLDPVKQVHSKGLLELANKLHMWIRCYRKGRKMSAPLEFGA